MVEKISSVLIGTRALLHISTFLALLQHFLRGSTRLGSLCFPACFSCHKQKRPFQAGTFPRKRNQDDDGDDRERPQTRAPPPSDAPRGLPSAFRCPPLLRRKARTCQLSARRKDERRCERCRRPGDCLPVRLRRDNIRDGKEAALRDERVTRSVLVTQVRASPASKRRFRLRFRSPRGPRHSSVRSCSKNQGVLLRVVK